MFPILFVLFLTVPVIEIAVFIQVGGFIGLWPTLAIVILTAIAGTSLLRAQGLKVAQDAQAAIDFFTARQIKLPEVTTIQPGKPAEVELSYRNVSSCDVKVYQIDLMKYVLLHDDLHDIAAINLAGIRPQHDSVVELPDAIGYRDKQQQLSLQLEKAGAYLVVARSGDQHTSGLVVVTPLDVLVQEDVVTGNLRVTVRDATRKKYVSGVHVKVIGTADAEFQAGETDLRGVFVANEIHGTATAIARTPDGQYAFYRGTREIGEAYGGGSAGGQVDLLRGFMGGNSGFGGRATQRLRGMYQPSGGIGGGGFF